MALVTLLQFREGLSDRRAAEAVRARIDREDLLGLDLADPGFDHSVSCEFRGRRLRHGATERLLARVLDAAREGGLLKARGRRQRTDSTHVLAAVRDLNRVELLAETLRAALNAIAVAAPDWLRGVAPVAPEAWYKRHARRVEDSRLPRTKAEREAYARTVGEDGFALLDRLDQPEAPEGLQRLPAVEVLRQVWARHFEKDAAAPGGVRLRSKEELSSATAPIESPYDPQARYRTRAGVAWIGYIVHLTESCEDDLVHLLTHAMTTTAAVHEARCTAAIHHALAAKGLVPGEHLVDAGYVDAELVVRSREDHGVDLVGPPRVNPTWQTKVEGGYTLDRFEIDWAREQARCPQGQVSSAWHHQTDHAGMPYISVRFRKADCAACPARHLCTQTKHQARHLKLQPRAEYEALKAARERLTTEEGRRLYARRAGIEGTLSQGVRAFGLRRSRYRGLVKTHLQHVATAAAINLQRLTAWFQAIPRATTRTSRFAALAA